VEGFLQKLPVDALWGVGPVTATRLRERGIARLVDIRSVDPKLLRETVGSLGDWLLQLAAGQDDRPVEPNRASKSSSSECTYAHDLLDLERIREEVAHMARDNAQWLVKQGLLARTVTIKVRYDNFATITRSDTRPPTNDPDQIQERAVRLLTKTEAGTRPVRLLGAGVHNIGKPEEEEIKEEDPQGRLPF
jgi:nucleotidyltransferase/DNA polymerase involved in DNA repair